MPDKRGKMRSLNIRVFSTIVVITALISIMLKLNKDFNFIAKVPVSFYELPKDKLLKSYTSQEVSVRGIASGYNYLKYRFFDQNFKINLSELKRKDSTLYFYDFNEEEDRLSGSLATSEIKSFEPDTLFFILDKNFEKKVEVRSRINYNFAAGYGSLRGLSFLPDSVLVRGPETSIDTLEAVYTEPVSFTGIKQDMRDSVSLVSYKPIKQLEIDPGKVGFSLSVDKFTEGSLVVPIQVINVPAEVTAKIFPKRVKLIFNVNLKNYNRLKSSNFKVICDFDKIDSTSTSLTPEIVQYPSYVRDLRLGEKTVQYLLVK